MAGFTGIAAVGTSIVRLLTQAFTERQPVSNKISKAALIRTDDLADDTLIKNLIGDLGLTILLYRVDFNKTMRAAWSAVCTKEGAMGADSWKSSAGGLSVIGVIGGVATTTIGSLGAGVGAGTGAGERAAAARCLRDSMSMRPRSSSASSGRAPDTGGS